MKKNIVIITSIVFVIIIVIAGIFTYYMARNEVFKGTIESINNGIILVIPDEGEDIRKSSDKIAMGINKKDNDTFSVGQKVSIKYNGQVQETYPAQIKPIKITIIK